MTQKKRGFTLVELAIVMTIIGLLIGGILKGQELLENARVTSTIAQAKSYDAAVTAFRDIYAGIPGDMPNAQNRIPGCTVACDNTAAYIPTMGAANDGFVGNIPWSETNGRWGNQAISLQPNTEQVDIDAETTLFWIHLLKANLITGINDKALSENTTAEWNVTHPAAKIGGGWVVGNADGGNPVGQATSTTSGPHGIVIGLTTAARLGLSTDASGVNVLTPSRAGQIDRKMDDGKPGSGSVQAYGTPGSAASGSMPATGCFVVVDGSYSEANTSKDCGLMMQIQG